VTSTTIFVALLDEGVDVWRPVEATIEADGVYLIVTPELQAETWQIASGSRVRCEMRDLSDGAALVAVKAS